MILKDLEAKKLTMDILRELEKMTPEQIEAFRRDYIAELQESALKNKDWHIKYTNAVCDIGAARGKVRTSIYDSNKTMQILGKQYTWGQVPLKKVFRQMDDILRAYRESKGKYGDKEICMDCFSLGFIYGKRAERAKRKMKGQVD